jgi:translation initiation factor eIF-2B subunit gamma
MMNFEEPNANLVSHEFLAVILAGFGDEWVWITDFRKFCLTIPFRLHPLIIDHGDQPCPKALLPVANMPMIDFPLTWLEQSGITGTLSVLKICPGMNITQLEVLLICPTAHRSSISHHIHSDTSSSSYPSLHVDVQTYDESPDEPVGTCAVLKHFSSRIQRDFVVLPCDFIPPEDLSLSSLLNKYRVESNLDGAIVTSCWLKAHGTDKGAVPEEWGRIGSSVSIIWDKKSGTLLHIDTPDDLDRNSDELEIRMSLLSRSVSLRGRDDELTLVLKISCRVSIVPIYGFSCIRLQAIGS